TAAEQRLHLLDYAAARAVRRIEEHLQGELARVGAAELGRTGLLGVARGLPLPLRGLRDRQLLGVELELDLAALGGEVRAARRPWLCVVELEGSACLGAAGRAAPGAGQRDCLRSHCPLPPSR